ncbi:MAG: WcaF family extracellular polysaccharide biosynthesis acetyltransferase [Planctomycetaceae bacterium]
MIDSTCPDESTLEVSVTAAENPSPHTTYNKLRRVVWWLIYTCLFRLSPRVTHRWRCFLLRLFGARVGRGVKVDPSCRIWAPWLLNLGDESAISHGADCYNVAPIHIGSHATVSQRAFLCTASHDPADPHMRLTSAPIKIGDQAWICAEAFVSPGVVIGKGAVAAARAVVTRDVAPWTIVGGNPAEVIKQRKLMARADD